MDVLHKIWVNLWAPFSWQFTVAILVLMAIDLYTYYKSDGRKHRHLTGLMTGAGILGTFFGIVVGLQDFNPSKIQDSIGPLLEGMKVAFITSVMGIAAAIVTELIEKLWPSPYAKSGDPVADSLSQHMLSFREVMEDVKKGSQSVSENVAAMRSEMRDEAGKVRRSLEEALQALSKGATEEIIKALEDVIKDFNRNLTEQFGENFKQLNEACLKLVEWQAAYKEAVEISTAGIFAAKEAMDGSRKQLEAVAPLKERFYEVVKETGLSVKALVVLNDRLEALAGTQQEVLNGFASAIDDAKRNLTEAATTVSQEQRGVISGFATLAQNAEQSRDRIEKMLGEHARGHKLVSDNIEEVVSKLGNGNTELQRHLKEALGQLENSLTSLTRDFGGAYNRYIELMRTLVARGN